MSIYLDDITKKIFIDECKHAYQEGGKPGLRDTVWTKDANGGKIVEFRYASKGTAQQRTNVHTPIPVMNIDYDPKTATMTNWTASELTDIFKNRQVGLDERKEVADIIAKALRRREDQIILDTLLAFSGSYTNTVAVAIGGADTNLNYAKVREAAKKLDNQGVDEDDRHFVIHSNNMHKLMSESQVTSFDFNTDKVLQKGSIHGRTWYSFDWHKIGTRSEGGLTLGAGSVRKTYAYHKNAVGFGINMEPEIMVDWDPTYGAWRVTGYLSAAAVIIDEKGIVEVSCDEDDA